MHLFIKKAALMSCPKCGKKVLTHTMCWNCGYYKQTEIIDVLKKLTKKEKKAREKEMAVKEKEVKRAGGKEKELDWREPSEK